MNDNSKKLKRMATWTIAVFATIFAIVMAVLWIPLFNNGASAFAAIGQAFAAGWLIFVVVAVLCIAAYFGYKYYLDRKK
jgi:zinc transporter ZupT